MTTYTTRLALPRPEGTEPADGPDAFNDLTAVLDPIIPPFAMGAIGVRPAPTLAGRLYYATDEGLLYFATGSAWIILNAPQSVDWKTGDMKFTGRDDLEAGWLWARGQAESRSSYPDLFAEYGTRYGPGDGTSTFNMPDARGRVLVGLDTGAVNLPGATALGMLGGSKEHTLTGAQSGIGVHAHVASSADGQETSGGVPNGVGDPRVKLAAASVATAAGSNTAHVPPSFGDIVSIQGNDLNNLTIQKHNHPITVNPATAAPASSPHPIVQPFCTVNVIVKT